MSRIGRQVVIVLPNPLSPGFYTGYGHQSYIHKIDLPNGLHIKDIRSACRDTIFLDPDVFKIFQ
jgi:hypothetical protein